MPKKILNWTAIQVLYESGTPPREIAKQYSVTPEQIYRKAARGNWKKQKEKKTEEILESSFETQKNTLAELCSLTDRVHLDFMRKFYEKTMSGQNILEQITNPYLFDGEKVNTLFNTAMNNATKIRMAQFKQLEPEKPDTLPEPEAIDPDDAISAIKKITGE